MKQLTKKKTEHEEKQVTFLHDLEKKKKSNQKSCFITEFQVKECTSVVAPVDGHEKTVHDVDTWDHILKADDSKDRKWNKNKVHSLACIFSQHATGSHSPTEIPHKRHETTSCSHSHLQAVQEEQTASLSRSPVIRYEIYTLWINLCSTLRFNMLMAVTLGRCEGGRGRGGRKKKKGKNFKAPRMKNHLCNNHLKWKQIAYQSTACTLSDTSADTADANNRLQHGYCKQPGYRPKPDNNKKILI